MNEIAVFNRMQNPIEAIEKLGQWFAKSGMFKCTRQEQGQVLALVCMCEQKSPIEVLRQYHLTEDGQLAKKTMAAYAEFRGKGGKVKWLDIGETPNADKTKWAAKAEIAWDGQTVTMAYSMADAERQQLLRKGGNWDKTPGKMLRARLLSNAIGMLAPEIYAGDCEENDPLTQPDGGLLKGSPAPATAPTAATVKEKEAAPGAAPAPAPAPKEERVIDVAATVVPIAPEEKPAPTGGISVETVQALESAIGEAHAEKALAWLKTRGWITHGLQDISEERAKRILNKPAVFLATINGQGV